MRQATENNDKASRVFHLYNAKKSTLVEMPHSEYSTHALDWFFEQPIFSSSDFVESAGIPAPTARRILSLCPDINLQKTLSEPSGRKPGVHAFTDLLNIVEGYEAF